MSPAAPHVVLLGDSIFDNAAYVSGGPDVVAHLRALLPAGGRATLLAVDGAVVADVDRQVGRIPADATHLVLSAGGNDALAHLDVLDRRAASMGEALELLAAIRAPFAERYERLVGRLTARGLPLVACTIYNGRLGEPTLQRRAQTALVVFNDAIVQAALAAGATLLELRNVCTEPGDYANPIEPSVQGGAKIARGILDAIR